MKKVYFFLFFLAFANAVKAQTVWGTNNSRTEWRDNASLQGNAGAISGFYETQTPVNYPPGATSWWHLLDVRHNHPSNNYSMQLAGSFSDQQLWFRKIADNPAQPWSRVLLETNGKVGIGTTTPTAPLEVLTNQSSIAIFKNTSAYNTMISVSNNTGQVNIGVGALTPHPYIWSGTGKFFIGDDGNPTIFIDDMTNGSVGIGTTTPGPYKLAVEGTIGARKIKVTLVNPWADYVFDSSYHLPSLAEVEKYIQQHKHLPDVPSAAEVEKNGLDLGDNQAVLLKKIEELTLYIIEQNKKSEDQQKRIELLEQHLKLSAKR